MRLAQIILPEYDNNGDSVIEAHRYLQKALSETFGGYTSLRSQGGWVDPKSGQVHTEPGKVYQVAMETDDWSVGELRAIASLAGTMAFQKAIFVVFPTHDVEIIDLESTMPVAHFMHGLEDIKRLNNAATEKMFASLDKLTNDREELERATKYVKLLRAGYGLMHNERNEAADLLAAAYGVEE